MLLLLGDDSWAFSSSFRSRVGPELITSAASCYHKGWFFDIRSWVENVSFCVEAFLRQQVPLTSAKPETKCGPKLWY